MRRTPKDESNFPSTGSSKRNVPAPFPRPVGDARSPAKGTVQLDLTVALEPRPCRTVRSPVSHKELELVLKTSSVAGPKLGGRSLRAGASLANGAIS